MLTRNWDWSPSEYTGWEVWAAQEYFLWERVSTVERYRSVSKTISPDYTNTPHSHHPEWN